MKRECSPNPESLRHSHFPRGTLLRRKSCFRAFTLSATDCSAACTPGLRSYDLRCRDFCMAACSRTQRQRATSRDEKQKPAAPRLVSPSRSLVNKQLAVTQTHSLALQCAARMHDLAATSRERPRREASRARSSSQQSVLQYCTNIAIVQKAGNPLFATSQDKGDRHLKPRTSRHKAHIHTCAKVQDWLM